MSGLDKNKNTAYNLRFGIMAAVTSQTILRKIERYYSVASAVKAATMPSRQTLGVSWATARFERRLFRKVLD